MEPLTSIHVENYQSLGATSIELGALTVIVGKGNTGKSALLRALTGALFNDTGSDFIRQGQKKCRVTLGFGEGTVTWEKDEKSAQYVVSMDGVPPLFTKLAGGVPVELQSLFGIKAIEIDKTFSIRPQIHGQFDAPLLLTESAGKAARALAKLTKLEMVMQAQTASVRDLRRAKQTVTHETQESESLSARLAEFPDMERQEVRITRARTALEEADTRLSALGVGEDAYALMLDAQRRLQAKLPTLDDLDGLTGRVNKMQNSLLACKVMTRAAQGVELTHQAQTQANFKVQSAEADLETFLTTLGVCPICGNPITGDHKDV